jgi:hypothetical protein
MSQLSCGITNAASRSQAAGDGVVAVGATVAEDREQMVVPRRQMMAVRFAPVHTTDQSALPPGAHRHVLERAGTALYELSVLV